MKRKTAFLCAVVFAVFTFGLAACGGKKDNSGQGAGASGTQTESGAQESGVPESSAPAQSTPAQESTAAQGSTPAQDGGAADGDAAEGWSEEMSALREAVVAELGDEYWPETAMPADYIETYYGLSSDMYEDYMGEMPLMSTKVDTLLIVKAREGQAEAVEEALKAYQKDQAENSLQYPMNMAKVQAAKVERIGNYVCYALLGGDITPYEEQGDEAIIRYCQEQNDRAIETISANIGQ